MYVVHLQKAFRASGHLIWCIKLNVLVFLGYIFLYSIANKLSIDNAYLLFNPSAGLALAAAIFYKNNSLIAIAFGALVSFLFWPEVHLSGETGFYGALLYSLCSVLAARIGAEICNPNHEPGWEPRTTDLVLRFALFGCFGSSLILLLPSFLSTLFLPDNPALPLTNLGIKWVANSAGSICLTPVFLKIFKTRTTDLLRLPWRGILSPMAVAFLGLYLFHQQYRSSNELVLSGDQEFLEDVAVQVVNKTEKQEQVLLSTIALRRASSYVSPDEFNQFTYPLLRQNPEIRALEWAPNVRHRDREEFVSKIRNETGNEDFEIREMSPQGSLIFAGDRDSYVPISYLNPLVGNERALGLDLLFNESRKTTLEAAVRSQRAVMTPPIYLVQDSGHDRLGALMVIASFNEKRQLEGYAIGVYDIEALLKTELNKEARSKWSFEISDTTLSGMSTRLATYGDSMCNPRDSKLMPVSIDILGRTLSISACKDESVLLSNQFNLVQLLGFTAAIAGAQILFLTMANEENEANYKASHDELTKLLNRRGFNDKIKELDLALGPNQAASIHSLLFIDLDGFKSVNDSMGHDAGDKVLQSVASCIAQTIRNSDFAARLGGDEFCVLFVDCDSLQCEVLANELIDKIEDLNHQIEHPAARIGASMGISEIYSLQGLQEALMRADKACYNSKNQTGSAVSVAST